MQQRGKLTGSGEAPDRIPSGEGRIVHNVARAYIDGLERDRRELHALQQEYDRLVWETIQISSYARALYLALRALYDWVESGRTPHWERIEELLNADRQAYHDVWSCACGHHRYDHDENGQCEYLACRHICGKEQ
jgi:hypothetical protein